MKRALIGYTGFVGSNLLRQQAFTHLYNSKNISEIKGESFDEIYFCGLPAEKWKANLYPEKDMNNITNITKQLESVKCNRFVLISTVDVYENLQGVDEKTEIKYSNHHAYGRHRYFFENFVKQTFKNFHIIRLPGLFGKGLKKNIIFDFLKDNEVYKIESRNIFQFYPLDRLSDDINLAIVNDIRIINLSTEPISVKEVSTCIFDKPFENHLERPLISYNMKTIYDGLFNGNNGYIMNKQEVMDSLKSLEI